jgi:gamma-glutamylcyclotransferase (GGCT)/AIG2-like uncharacterized protein YtfP
MGDKHVSKPPDGNTLGGSKIADMTSRFFAYGTLRQGHAPVEIASSVERLSPLGRGVARGRCIDLGAYPGAIFDDTGDEIEGEVYDVPNDSIWAELDAYEGFEPENPAASLFIRKLLTVRRIDGTGDVLCWAYEYNGAEDAG